jgi:hypothetical protein
LRLFCDVCPKVRRKLGRIAFGEQRSLRQSRNRTSTNHQGGALSKRWAAAKRPAKPSPVACSQPHETRRQVSFHSPAL